VCKCPVTDSVFSNTTYMQQCRASAVPSTKCLIVKHHGKALQGTTRQQRRTCRMRYSLSGV
jgi:hypothetical protein